MIHLIYITLIILAFFGGIITLYLRLREIIGTSQLGYIVNRYQLSNVITDYWDEDVEELILDSEQLLDETPDVVDFLHTLIITRNWEEVKFKWVYKGNEYEFIWTTTSDTI